MGIQRAVLLIADIGGYTNYMHWNRKHLAHAQWTVAQLLESVIDAAKGMKLAKLGATPRFWAPGATPVSWYATGPRRCARGSARGASRSKRPSLRL